MVRPIPIIIAALSVPTLCMAQSWPATTASGVQARAPQASVLLALAAQRPVQPRLHRPQPPRTNLPAPAAEREKLEIKAKDEWFDDQGVRFSAKGLTFKQRF